MSVSRKRRSFTLLSFNKYKGIQSTPHHLINQNHHLHHLI